MNDDKNKELVSQVPVLFQKLDLVANEAHKALVLAEHADRGFVELSVEFKNIKNNISALSGGLESLRSDLGQKIDKIIDNDKKNILWMVGLFTFFISIMLGIKFY